MYFQPEVDDCIDVNCLNGGRCIDKNAARVCECTGRFTGSHCEYGTRISLNILDNCFMVEQIQSEWYLIKSEHYAKTSTLTKISSNNYVKQSIKLKAFYCEYPTLMVLFLISEVGQRTTQVYRKLPWPKEPRY